MSNKLYDDKVEEHLLSLLLKDISFVDKAMMILQGNFFYRKEYINLFGAIKKSYELYHRLLTKEMLESFLDRSFRKQLVGGRLTENELNERKNLYLNLYVKLSSNQVDSNNLIFLCQEVRDLKTKRELYEVTKETIDDLKSGKLGKDIVKGVEQKLNKIRLDSGDITINKRLIHEESEKRWEEYVDRRDHPEKYIGVLFGLQELDTLTNGMQKGEIGMVFARTGRGKSRFLFNYGYNASKKKFHVMYASLEMYINQLERMYDSRDARISYTKLKMGKLSPEEEKSYQYVLSQQKKRQDFFYTVDIPRGCNMSLLEAEVDNYEQKFGHSVDLLIVDYLMLMKSTNYETSTSERLGAIAREMKELARLKKFVLFTANQANRAVTDSNMVSVGTEHISLSDQIAPQCDYVAYLDQSNEDRLKNLLQNYVIKYRDGAGKKMTHYVNWDCNFIGDRVLNVGVGRVNGQ